MKIGGFDTAERVMVVAEIGNNHEGDADRAFRLLEAAADAGADAVKFQTYQTAEFVGRADPARFERLRRFELPWEVFPRLARRARERGLRFLSTPLDLESARRLSTCVDAFKIASGDNLFLPLLETVASYPLPTLVSLGLTDEAAARAVLATLDRLWPAAGGASERVGVLHCVTAYPVPPEQANVSTVRTLAGWTALTVGYSDHTLGAAACRAAVALGARVIEKHFTLDKAFSDFRDHAISADPADLADLVRGVRETERLLGRPGKWVLPVEKDLMVAARRSIVAARSLSKGRTLASADLRWVRPGGGLAPGREKELLGRRLSRDVPEGARLSVDDLEPA